MNPGGWLRTHPNLADSMQAVMSFRPGPSAFILWIELDSIFGFRGRAADEQA
jgi:hypothetical protein